MSVTKITDDNIVSVESSKLTGALPAIDGSNLTGIVSGPTISSSDPTITTNATLGTQWANSSTGEFFILTDATTDENVWTNVGGGTGDVGGPTQVQGTISGYRAGGYQVNIIDKFSIVSHTNSTDVGDLTAARYAQSGTASRISGYAAGGVIGYSQSTIIDKWSFATDANATSVGSLSPASYVSTGTNSTTHGYHAAGVSSNTIQKYTYSTDANSTDVGDLTVARRSYGSAGSETDGHVLGGNTPSTTTIDKFSFSSDANSTDFGDILVGGGRTPAGSNSATHGYSLGGGQPVNHDTIDKFAFTSGGTATDVANLTTPTESMGDGCSSDSGGYLCGGVGAGNIRSLRIERHSFSSDTDSVDVASLAVRSGAQSESTSGNQI